MWETVTSSHPSYGPPHPRAGWAPDHYPAASQPLPSPSPFSNFSQMSHLSGQLKPTFLCRTQKVLPVHCPGPHPLAQVASSSLHPVGIKGRE